MDRGTQDSDRAVTVVAVSGYRDSGKTTAIEGIVRELRRRGYRVGTIKHCHHGYDLDHRGKDSWRHLQAGAESTVLVAPNGYALLSTKPPEEDPRRLAEDLLPGVDIALAEGFHWLPLPRIAIEERGGDIRPADAGGEIVARLGYHFGPKDIDEACDAIVARCLDTRETSPQASGNHAAD